jgi:hypothetical protein
MKTETATTAIRFLKKRGGKIGELAQGLFAPGAYRPIGQRLNEIEKLLRHEKGTGEKSAAAEMLLSEIGLLKFLIHPPPDEGGCVLEDGPEEIAYHAVRLGAELMRFAMDNPESEISEKLDKLLARDPEKAAEIGYERAMRKRNKKRGPLGRKSAHDDKRWEAAMKAMHKRVTAGDGMAQEMAAGKIVVLMKLDVAASTVRTRYAKWLKEQRKHKKG